MVKEFQLYGVFQSDNIEKLDQKSISKLNEKEGTTNEILLSLDLINMKDGNNFYVGVSKL